MNLQTVLGVLAIVVPVVASAVAGRSAYLAQRVQSITAAKVAQADRDVSAGKLALEYARDVDSRLQSLEQWRYDITDGWLPEHLARDIAIERELLKLDPTAQIPAPVPFPPLRRQP